MVMTHFLKFLKIQKIYFISDCRSRRDPACDKVNSGVKVSFSK